MKRLLLTLTLVFIALPMWAQSEKETDQKRYGKGQMPFDEKGEVIFSKVVYEEGYDKKAIYNAVKICISNMFNSAKDVIQLDEPKSGIIIVKGFAEEPSRGLMGTIQNAQVWFTIKIQTKDNRYKIDIYQIKGHYPGGVVNNIYINPTDWPAEQLNYETCFRPNGKMKTAREGFYRRAIIDCCNRLLDQIQKTVHNDLTTDSANTEEW